MVNDHRKALSAASEMIEHDVEVLTEDDADEQGRAYGPDKILEATVTALADSMTLIADDVELDRLLADKTITENTGLIDRTGAVWSTAEVVHINAERDTLFPFAVLPDFIIDGAKRLLDKG